MLPPSFFSTGPNTGLQAFEFLRPLAHFLTFLGREEFFLLLLPLVYLCFDRRRGARLGALLLASESLNVCLKVLFALPRPYWIDTRVRELATDASFGLPSSHAQNAAAVWPFLAHGKRWGLRVGAALLVAGIALSRVYLGVHFLGDVVVGVLIGTLALLAFWHLAPRGQRWFLAQNAARQAVAALSAALAVLALFGLAQVLAPSREGEAWARFADFEAGAKAIVGRAGSLAGLLIGVGACARRGLFEASGSAGQKATRMALALIGVAFFWKGLALVMPREPLWAECLGRFVRYGAMAWWVTDGVPRLFEKRTAPVSSQ